MRPAHYADISGQHYLIGRINFGGIFVVTLIIIMVELLWERLKRSDVLLTNVLDNQARTEDIHLAESLNKEY